MHVLREDRDARAARRVDDGGSAVNGTQSATSTPSTDEIARQQAGDELLGLGDRLVHLPVAGDERACGSCFEHLDAGQRLAFDQLERGAAAGRQVGDVVGEAELRAAPRRCRRRRRPSSPGVAATASATARVPAANGSSSNAPIGPFQNTVPGVADLVGVRGRRPRPDVEAHPAVGHVDAVELAPLGVGGEAVGEHEVDCGSRSLPLAVGERAPRRLDALLLAQRGADVVALGREEREAHRAADQDRVGVLEERVDDADLVGHLRAADDRDERALRVGEDAAQRLDLALEQAARGARQQRARRPRSRRARGARRRTRR